MAKKKKVLKNLVEKNSCGFCGKTRNLDEDSAAKIGCDDGRKRIMIH